MATTGGENEPTESRFWWAGPIWSTLYRPMLRNTKSGNASTARTTVDHVAVYQTLYTDCTMHTCAKTDSDKQQHEEHKYRGEYNPLVKLLWAFILSIKQLSISPALTAAVGYCFSIYRRSASRSSAHVSR